MTKCECRVGGVIAENTVKVTKSADTIGLVEWFKIITIDNYLL